MDQAIKHLHGRPRNLGMGQQRQSRRPDVVMPVAEMCRPRNTRRRRPPAHYLPELKVRVINIVNLMKLQPQSEHPQV